MLNIEGKQSKHLETVVRDYLGATTDSVEEGCPKFSCYSLYVSPSHEPHSFARTNVHLPGDGGVSLYVRFPIASRLLCKPLFSLWVGMVGALYFVRERERQQRSRNLLITGSVRAGRLPWCVLTHLGRAHLTSLSRMLRSCG